MAKLTDRVTHSDELRSLRDKASAVMDQAAPVAEATADRARAAAADVGRTIADPMRQALAYLPTILAIVASFRSRSAHAAEDAIDRVQSTLPSRRQVQAALPARDTMIASVRPILFGMLLATAGYAAYRYARRR